MRWKVFLPESSIKAVEKKVHELAEGLVVADVLESGLMGGAAGVACFYAYYADWTGDLHFKGLAEEMVEQALSPPAGHFPEFSFSNGYAGIAWTLQHLMDQKLLEIDATSVVDKLNPLLAEHMLEDIRDIHYDYLHGSLGYAFYFLSLSGEECFYDELSTVVKELDRLAMTEEDGSKKWLSVLDADNGLKGFNLSLSHGMASIMIMLSQFMSHGIEEALCQRLLDGAYKYLRKQQLSGTEYISVYPSWALESMEEPGNSRMAWCYGDLGIALACLHAGKAINDPVMFRHGEDLIIRSCARKDLKSNRVMDAGLCHGAAGLALIFNTAYQNMLNEETRIAAEYWLGECLKMDTHSDGIAGYKAWYHPKYGGWVKVPGLLEGAAGIGLALLSFISNREPAWSKSLLL